MALLANQILLPLCLALIMLVMGTGLSLQSFLPVLHKPKAVLLGIVAQLLLLPMIVWVLILALHLPPVIAAALVLIACAPGGATSNLFSKLADGDLPLSIALTAVISLFSPLWMPWAAQTQLGWLGYDIAFKLSYAQVVLQLIVVTALPLILGMGLRKLYPNWVQANEQRLKQMSVGLLMLMILALIVVNAHVLPSVFGLSALMVLLLATLALVLGYALARLLGLSQAQSRTLSFETGVQNAGMAIMIAFSFLQAPELGMVALLYGILMNIPAFITLWVFKRGQRSLKNKQPSAYS